jgi:hypothetical protein
MVDKILWMLAGAALFFGLQVVAVALSEWKTRKEMQLELDHDLWRER